jgi:Protein of unknown function (DUF2384)
MAWTISPDRIEPPADAAALADIRPLFRRLVKAFGPRPLSRLLDVGPGTVANWTSGHRTMSAEMIRRVIALHDIWTRALQIFQPATAARWLVGNEPLLEGQRPIDVLTVRGAAPVIEALDNIDVGAYG